MKSPTGRLLLLDRKARTLTVRPSIFDTRTYALKDVAGLTSGNRGSKPDPLHYIRRSMPRTLRLRLKRGGTVALVHLPTTNFINLGRPRTEAIMLAKRVAEEMNRYLVKS